MIKSIAILSKIHVTISLFNVIVIFPILYTLEELKRDNNDIKTHMYIL